MKKNRIRSIILIVCLMTATCLAMAYSGQIKISKALKPPLTSNKPGIVSVSGKLSQNKIYSGSDGIVSLELILKADDILGVNADSPDPGYHNIDMVIVLDRSGSMSGKKIQDAKKAVLNLIENLSPADRFALVAYSDGVTRLSNLSTANPYTRKNLTTVIKNLPTGGGTNLGQGLAEGINLLMSSKTSENPGRLILISDGLANQGVTNPIELGNMASIAAEKAFSISTVGVGSEFNEQLMTAISDRGTGNYYYLEDPSNFAAVFREEFQGTRTVAASSVKVKLAEKNGIQLVDAGGFPIERKHQQASFYLGDIVSGETKKLFLNLRVPTDREMSYTIPGIEVQYRHKDRLFTATPSKTFRLSCVKDPKEAMASINKKIWTDKVLRDDFNRLREEVAKDIRVGRKKEAEEKMDAYYAEQQEINAYVQSEAVAQNLDRGLSDLRQTVNDTFLGNQNEVAEKQKRAAKKLQYKGYNERRMKSHITTK